jgi:multicomponent Na+:H+ antiporter subunit D
MNVLIVLPIFVPFVTAIVTLLLRPYRQAQRAVSVTGAAALLVAGLALLHTVWHEGIIATQAGNWPAPFGITLVADLLSAIMVVLTGMMGFAVAVYSLATIDPGRERYAYHPLYHVLLMGVCGAFITGDVFNLYVWFEVLLISSFVLMALGGEQAQLEGAIKYVTLNLVSSSLFLAAIGILYGTAGTLNMADLSVGLDRTHNGLVLTLAMLFLVAFGIKAAIFPLFAWLPASYHTPPVAVSAIFAGLLTKVGVYALIRVFTLMFTQEVAFTHGLILVVAGLTMITGVLGAAAQNEFRRILSFHIVSQIGYMLMGLGLYTTLGLAGSIFYIAHHIVVKTNLFLVSGVSYWLKGTFELRKLGGLYRAHPFVGVLFLIPALSLAGMPPLSGFWAKLILVRSGIEIGQYLIVGVALAVSLLTLFSMTKIWAEAFWKEAPDPSERVVSPATWRGLVLPIASLAAVTVFIGLVAEPLMVLAVRAAEQLMDPAEYVRVVFEGRP